MAGAVGKHMGHLQMEGWECAHPTFAQHEVLQAPSQMLENWCLHVVIVEKEGFSEVFPRRS